MEYPQLVGIISKPFTFFTQHPRAVLAVAAPTTCLAIRAPPAGVDFSFLCPEQAVILPTGNLEAKVKVGAEGWKHGSGGNRERDTKKRIQNQMQLLGNN